MFLPQMSGLDARKKKKKKNKKKRGLKSSYQIPELKDTSDWYMQLLLLLLSELSIRK
jgi:hypothetical protein